MTTVAPLARTCGERCLEDAGGAAAAGAEAIEVCGGLADGGTTPTLGFVRHCIDQAPDLEHRVLVRARPGSSCVRAPVTSSTPGPRST